MPRTGVPPCARGGTGTGRILCARGRCHPAHVVARLVQCVCRAFRRGRVRHAAPLQGWRRWRAPHDRPHRFHRHRSTTVPPVGVGRARRASSAGRQSQLAGGISNADGQCTPRPGQVDEKHLTPPHRRSCPSVTQPRSLVRARQVPVSAGPRLRRSADRPLDPAGLR